MEGSKRPKEVRKKMPNQIIQYPVPLMLKKILKDKSSGELIVVGKNFTRNLFFSEGDLIFARTDVIEERLGEILFKIGKINRDQFLSINELITAQNERIGKILVQQKILNQRDLFFALVYQLRAIATSTFSLVSGEWNFVNKAPEVPGDSQFRVQLAGIITEGTNRLGSISYFRNKFYYKAPKAAPIPDSMKEFLSNYELDFYNELIQFKNLPNSHIIPKMKIAEDIFWKKVVLFYLLNIIDFVDAAVDKELDKNLEEILKLYEQVKLGRSDYYEILGVQHTANYNEIKNAYFDYAKKYHPDRITSAPDPDIKEKANYVFAEINKAYDTLGNPDKKKVYDSKGYKEDNQVEPVQENLAERARLLHRKAKSLYNLKKYWEASSLLDEAVRLDPGKAPYFLLLGMCQMNLPQFRRRAADNLQKAIDLEHWNVDAFIAMGLLLMSENQPLRAEGFFRKVLSINPDHAVARQKLAEITGKSDKKGKFSLFGKKK
jgi:tetratricopeptide (TPR) repeat protein